MDDGPSSSGEAREGVAGSVHREVRAQMQRDPRARWLRRLAWLVAALLLVVVSASAWLRLLAPRAGCSDWPACRVAAQGIVVADIPATVVPGSPAGAAWVRGTHRVAASASLLLIVTLVVIASRLRAGAQGRSAEVGPMQHAAGRLPLALLALALALSALGIATPGSRSTLVLLGNLLGGLVMFALAVALARRLSAIMLPPTAFGAAVPSAIQAPWRIAAAAGALLWLGQAALGALAGAAPASGTFAPVLHFVLALVAVPWAFVVGLLARAAGRRFEGRALMALAAAQGVAGAASALAAAAPAVVLLHNAGTALGLAMLTSLALPRSPPPEG